MVFLLFISLYHYFVSKDDIIIAFKEYQEHKSVYLTCFSNIEMYYFVIIPSQNIDEINAFIYLKIKIFFEQATVTCITLSLPNVQQNAQH